MAKNTSDQATYNTQTDYLRSAENGAVLEGDEGPQGAMPGYWRNANARVTAATTHRRGKDSRTLAQHVKSGRTRVQLNPSIVLTIAALCAIHGDVENLPTGRAADQLVREYRELSWVHRGHDDPRWVLSLGFDLRSAMQVCEGGWESISGLIGETMQGVRNVIDHRLQEAADRDAELAELDRLDKERKAALVG